MASLARSRIQMVYDLNLDHQNGPPLNEQLAFRRSGLSGRREEYQGDFAFT